MSIQIIDNLNSYIDIIKDLQSKMVGLINIKLIIYKIDESTLELNVRNNTTIEQSITVDNKVLFNEICVELINILSLVNSEVLSDIDYIELCITLKQANEWHEEGSHIRKIIKLPIEML